VFDKCYIEAITCVMSKRDFEALGTSDTALLAGAASNAAKAMRLGLGVIL
jgi:hypothetical protein